MIAYATVGVLDLAASLAFYDAVLSALGYRRIHTGAHAVGYADAQRTSKLWVQEPYDGRPARAGNGIMIGFKAPSRAAVDAFHAAAPMGAPARASRACATMAPTSISPTCATRSATKSPPSATVPPES
jgi:catechol 2,3-dioxygenase-like lactoylglutathione lyase family enzyme